VLGMWREAVVPASGRGVNGTTYVGIGADRCSWGCRDLPFVGVFVDEAEVIACVTLRIVLCPSGANEIQTTDT